MQKKENKQKTKKTTKKQNKSNSHATRRNNIFREKMIKKFDRARKKNETTQRVPRNKKPL